MTDTPERARLVAAVLRALQHRDRRIPEIHNEARLKLRAIDERIGRAERALAAYDAAHRPQGDPSPEEAR